MYEEFYVLGYLTFLTYISYNAFLFFELYSKGNGAPKEFKDQSMQTEFRKRSFSI